MGCCKKEPNRVDQTDTESFPASDAPAWTLGTEPPGAKDEQDKKPHSCCSGKSSEPHPHHHQ